MFISYISKTHKIRQVSALPTLGLWLGIHLKGDRFSSQPCGAAHLQLENSMKNTHIQLSAQITPSCPTSAPRSLRQTPGLSIAPGDWQIDGLGFPRQFALGSLWWGGGACVHSCKRLQCRGESHSSANGKADNFDFCFTFAV